MTTGLPQSRWQTYVLERGPSLEPFWKQHLDERDRSLLFVLPASFDPRSTLALTQLLAASSRGRRDVMMLEYNQGEEGSYRELTEKNREAIQAVCNGKASLTSTTLNFYADGRRVVASRAADIFNSQSQLEPYSDIVIDISGMPRSVFFPLVARLLFLVDNYSNGGRRPNLLVVVAEDAALDTAISQEGMEEFAEFLPMFRGGFDQEATADQPSVWLPLLGEGRGVQLERILDLVKPEEICAVLPSPSTNPRRGDELVLEYRTLLFDQLRLDPRSFIYAAEQNPFEVYRSLRSAVLRYRDSLAALGGCKVAISALSSKLMSVGALLAAYELKCLHIDVGVAHVDCQTYRLSSQTTAPEFFALWLTGECYG